jgi:hypothetical protein
MINNIFLYFFIFMFTSPVFAQQYGWGVTAKEGDKKVKIGGRLQVLLQQDSENGAQDFYLRRTRLNILYKPWKGHSFNYDIRNDGANEADEGEQGFVIGDAFWKIDINKNTVNNIKLFRAKVDVSYSQTSSSKNLFNPQRAEVAEHASDFVVHNRRAVNAQVNGNIGNLAYHVVLSDGPQSGDLEDLNGNGIDQINFSKLTYGAKLRYYFFGDAKKNKLQDTFYGEHNTFSLGAGYFANDKINITESQGATSTFNIQRSLVNIDLSYSYKRFRLLAEYFEFTGDMIDLTGATREDIVGESNGYYAQVEYLITNNWAPYFIYESFNKNKEADDAIQNITTLGINYYQKLEAQRYGLAYKQTEDGADIGNSTQESLYAYFMVNF